MAPNASGEADGIVLAFLSPKKCATVFLPYLSPILRLEENLGKSATIRELLQVVCQLGFSLHPSILTQQQQRQMAD